MPDVDRYDGWILGVAVGGLPAAVPLGVVMGRWVGCGPDTAANRWLALGVRRHACRARASPKPALGLVHLPLPAVTVASEQESALA